MAETEAMDTLEIAIGAVAIKGVGVWGIVGTVLVFALLLALITGLLFHTRRAQTLILKLKKSIISML